MPSRDTIVKPEQAATVRALQSGSATGCGEDLRRIDTNLAHVFLGPRLVYKLKRAVHLPFVDLSTIAHRREACRAEMEANRAWAADLYLAAQPLRLHADGKLGLDGEGDIVDWVVVMKRFPDGALLSELAARGGLTAGMVAQLAARIAAVHASLTPHADAGHTADYLQVVHGLRQTEAEAAAAQGLKPASGDLFDRLDAEIRRVSPLIEARRRAGWVRHGHGDLHLRNIFVADGVAQPFDALEFDARLATTDVLYDLAFLLADLLASGAGDMANLAMNAYWDHSQTPESALALLPVFMALRAAVLTAVQVAAGHLATADRYRRLALRLLQHETPEMFAVGGLSGSGKSTLAHGLAPALTGPCGARVLSSDVVRKQLAGVSPETRLDAGQYGHETRFAVYEALAERMRETHTAGSSVIADATFQTEDMRRLVVAAASPYEILGIWLKTPRETRLERVAKRSGDASDATVEVAAAQVEPARLDPPWHAVSGALPLAEQRSAVLHLLRDARAA